MTRVTQLSLTSNFLRNLGGLSRSLERDQIKLATGLNYSKPSDGPLDVGQILGFRAQLTRITQFQANIADGHSQIDFVDDKLQSLLETSRAARTSVLQGVNGTLTRTDRLSISQDLEQKLRDIALTANLQLNGRHLFAGTRTQTLPFQSIFSPSDDQLADVLYHGNSRDIARRVGGGTRLDVNFPGDGIFLERTYTRQGKSLPPDTELGFSGTLVINGKEVTVGPADSLRDLADRISQRTDLGAAARVRDGALELFSRYAVDDLQLADKSNGDLLADLGLALRGPYTVGRNPINTAALPLVDSTGAIFQAAGDVASLAIDGDNDILNIHLGASANEGAAVSHIVRIPHGDYASVAELVAAIQGAADGVFGENRIVVRAVGNQIQVETAKQGAGITMGDLRIGGSIDGVQDTAADSATLNLIAGPTPVAQTNADIAGTDGTDRFFIDLGVLTSPDGVDHPPVEINLQAANTGTAAQLVDEINTQIRADVRLRGAVVASLQEGRLVIETTAAGKQIPATELAVTDAIPGVLTTLGRFTPNQAALRSNLPLTVPALITQANRELVVDLGPSIARSGVNIGPITLSIPPGTYNTSQALVAALNAEVARQPELAGQVIFAATSTAPNAAVRLQTVGMGSHLRGEDLAVSGSLAPVLRLGTYTVADGAGVAAGQGMSLGPRNLFRDLIVLRDDIAGLADANSTAKELTAEDGTPAGLFDRDILTVAFEGNTVHFRHRAGEGLGSILAEANRILRGRVTLEVGRDGRIVATNNEATPLLQFSLTAASPTGEPRTVFNGITAQLGTTVPGLGEARSGVFLDPRRTERASGVGLGELDLDVENLLGITAQIGARGNRLSLTSSVLTDTTANIQGLKTGVEAVNIVELITRLDAQEATLQAALNVGSRVLQPSLIQFLR
ncbi:MAG TPA: hypothetical protein VEI97_16830 [bacterium]|nr:hypothetical protein [bacterium]